ncbi:PE-PPE domain-containing protein [Mycobacterium sp. ITM-2017-0098]|nr:PE-PPE domain-containing protein [Mycobacterium sp. ITM-2017-0098]
MSKVRRSDRIGTTAISVAALAVAATVGGVAATQPASISASPVDLTALIVVGSSTHPDPTDVEDFFGGKFNQAPYNPGGQAGLNLVGVNFLDGPDGIDEALQANSGEDNAVLSSGWGAANASLLLNRLDRDADPALPTTLFVLDNNVSRPDGGFGTRYPLFALIGVNPFPSPTDTAAKAVVDIAYQYNYNSNAPADLLNLVAHVNSLVAYLYGYREQSGIDLPVDIDGRPTVSCAGANTCAVLASGADALACDDARCDTPDGDRVVAYVTTRGNTTYVTYTTEELPLARLLRDVFGDTAADVAEPLLKVIVDSAYYGGNPIPSDPSRYRPARLMPSLDELVSTASKVPAAIAQSLDALSANTSENDAPAVSNKSSIARVEPIGDDAEAAEDEPSPPEPGPTETEPEEPNEDAQAAPGTAVDPDDSGDGDGDSDASTANSSASSGDTE